VVAKGAAFERGMLNINSIAKVSRPELDAMGKSVLSMSGEFGQSGRHDDRGPVRHQLIGVRRGQGHRRAARASSKAATAGLATTSEAAKGITAVLNSYGLQAADSAHVSDVLFKTVERGVVSFPELSAVIGTTAALASPLGVSLEEVGAALSVMTRHGIDAENATTQLNAIMSSMLQPSVEAAALAKQLGIDWSSAASRRTA
jgi:TP901 family phage tail tape measure protein